MGQAENFEYKVIQVNLEEVNTGDNIPARIKEHIENNTQDNWFFSGSGGTDSSNQTYLVFAKRVTIQY